MKRLLTLLLLIMLCAMGYAQTIDTALEKEMGQRKRDEKIDVFVIMKQQYGHERLSRHADSYPTRAERRQFVVNELKQFAEVSQYDIRQSLAEMEKNDMVTTPRVLWMANALYFSANKQAIAALAQRKDVEIIGFDERVRMIPEDEAMKPVEAIRDITTNVTQVKADQVWDMGYTGPGIVVAVIDGGVNYNQLDLKDHLWDGGEAFPNHGWDFDANDNDPMDYHGHGTHCAGTLCGNGEGGRQTGIAPDATLMCLKVLDDEGYGEITNACAGVQFATEHGADIFSMSLGWRGISAADLALVRNTCVAAMDAGVIGAVAAGNEGHKLNTYPIPNNVRIPGCCPPPYLDPVQQANPGGLSCVVCVGNVDNMDLAWQTTSQGPVTWGNTGFADYPYTAGSSMQFGLIRPDVCAPGVEIISADYLNTTGYGVKTGTSMATPCVAGCMALMLNKNPNLTPSDLCRILEETAVPLAEGKSNIYGFGRVNALAAVNAVPAPVLSLESQAIHDEQGNNDQHANPGESITMDLGLRCGVEAINGATLEISTMSSYVDITNGSLVLPDFAAGETHTVGGFAFVLNDNAPFKSKIDFVAQIVVGGESVGYLRFAISVYGKVMQYLGATIVNDGNGNGLLEPGETADLRVVIGNDGNLLAPMVTGTLTTTSEYLTINGTATIGDVAAFGKAFADFSVTLAENATNAFPMPVSLSIVDAANETHQFDFNLYSITAESNMDEAGTISGTGTYGSGTKVALATTTNDNYAFIRWEQEGAGVSYTDPAFTASENEHYWAVFEPMNCFVQIGHATASYTTLPSHSNYKYAFTEQIYTPEELGGPRELTSISFFNNGQTKTRNYSIYLKQTDKTVFQSNTDWVPVTPMNKYFEGTVTLTAASWSTIQFERPFYYTGTSNLVLAVDDNTGSYSNGMTCRAFPTDGFQTLWIVSVDTNYNVYVVTTYYGTPVRVKNQVLFGSSTDDIKENTSESFCFVKDKMLYVSAEINHAKISVIDVLGRTVKTMELTGDALSVAELKAGLYFIRLYDGSTVRVQKIVIME